MAEERRGLILISGVSELRQSVIVRFVVAVVVAAGGDAASLALARLPGPAAAPRPRAILLPCMKAVRLGLSRIGENWTPATRSLANLKWTVAVVVRLV